MRPSGSTELRIFLIFELWNDSAHEFVKQGTVKAIIAVAGL